MIEPVWRDLKGPSPADLLDVAALDQAIHDAVIHLNRYRIPDPLAMSRSLLRVVEGRDWRFARLLDEDVCRAIIGPAQSAICAPNAIARQDRIRRRSILRAGTHAARRATERLVHRLFQKTDLTAAAMFKGNLNGAGQTGSETVALCHGFGPGVLAPWRGA